MRTSSMRKSLPSVSQNSTEPLGDASSRIGRKGFGSCCRLAAQAPGERGRLLLSTQGGCRAY
jgi:hypothetical protein